MTDKTTPSIPVWDRFIRLFHWSLVVAVTIAAISGFLLRPTWISLHIWAGGAGAVLLLGRVLWGIWGSQNARFSGFVKGPRAVLTHMRELRNGSAPRHLGHNPLGALMIIALLGTVLLLLLTGIAALGGVFKVGPLSFATTYQIGNTTLSLHLLLAYFLLALVVLHIAGAVYEGWRTRENLVKSMVTGKKEARSGDHPTPAVKPRPLRTLVIFIAALAALVGLGVLLASAPPKGGTVTVFDPTYADECSACHMAYPPSLLPAKSWRSLMAGLTDHYGEDATLGQKTTNEITAWLVANSADHADTKPSHVFASTSANASFTLTETPFWKATHSAIPKTTFSRPPIYTSGNCAACHSDAGTGAFYPANILIPKETTQ